MLLNYLLAKKITNKGKEEGNNFSSNLAETKPFMPSNRKRHFSILHQMKLCRTHTIRTSLSQINQQAKLPLLFNLQSGGISQKPVEWSTGGTRVVRHGRWRRFLG
jgi:hypothetical protein